MHRPKPASSGMPPRRESPWNSPSDDDGARQAEASEVLDAEALDQRKQLVPGVDAVLASMLVSVGYLPFPDRVGNAPVGGSRSGWLWPELEREHSGPVGLVRDGLGDPADAAVAATLDKDAMELIVGDGPGVKIVLPKSLFHACGRFLELIGDPSSIFVGHGGQQLCGSRFYGNDDIVDLPNVLRGERANLYAPLGEHTDEPVLLKPDDGLVHRRPAHAEPQGDFLLRTLIAGRKDIVADRLLQRSVGIFHQRRLPRTLLCCAHLQLFHHRASRFMMPVFELPYKNEWMVDKGPNWVQLSCMPTSMEAVRQ